MNGIDSTDPGRASKAVEQIVESATSVVFVDDSGEPFTVSDVIADETGNQHKNVLELIKGNLDDLNDVGRVAFETRPFETPGGTQRRQVALLDEPAAALLMTYLRNTPKVKDFKKRLVAGFYAMRRQLTEPAAPRRMESTAQIEDRTIRRLALLQAAKGLIDPHHLEAKARVQLAIGLGEAPELEPSCRPLYAQTYLQERGLSHKQIKAIGGMFGKRLKSAYVEQHGVPPKQYPLETGSGQIRNVNAYTEIDRALMDAVWDRYYAAVVS